VNKSDSVFSGGAIQGYFMLLLACGAALLFSIPRGARVAQLMELRWTPSPLVFHLTYVTLICLLGAFRGSAATQWDRPGARTLVHLAGHILFGQLTVLPCLLFSRSLLAGRDFVLPPLVLYATLTAFMFALLAFRLDLWGRARQTHTFMLQYALFGVLFVLPWVIGFLPTVPGAITLLSPIGATLKLVEGAPAAESIVSFAFVLAIISSQLLGVRRWIRRSHAI
jgi:hypothetical protein